MQATAIVIFGASGDLTSRKLIPALFSNLRKGRLPENTHIVGFSRTAYTDDEFRAKLLEGVRKYAPKMYDENAWADFSTRVHYQPGDMARMNQYIAALGGPTVLSTSRSSGQSSGSSKGWGL